MTDFDHSMICSSVHVDFMLVGLGKLRLLVVLVPAPHFIVLNHLIFLLRFKGGFILKLIFPNDNLSITGVFLNQYFEMVTGV